MDSAFADNELLLDFDDTAYAYDSDGRLLSAEQVNFFSNSKCRDISGSLLVMYHASSKEFDIFDAGRIGDGGGSIFGKGFYFCDDSFGLDIYGDHIREFYLNLQNPFIWEDDDLENVEKFLTMLQSAGFGVTDELVNELAEDVDAGDSGLDIVIEKTCGADFAQKYLIKAGFDGIINTAVGDYVAFSPSQIKLCINKAPTNSANVAA
jgi:hypothetical protein